MEKGPIIVKKNEIDEGRKLIEFYLRQQNLSSGEPNYNVKKIEEYLTKRNKETPIASIEEIEKAVDQMNQSIEDLQNLK
jgi:hypothetical protein